VIGGDVDNGDYGTGGAMMITGWYWVQENLLGLSFYFVNYCNDGVDWINKFDNAGLQCY
jgi:hypothetical protein